jgi:hypothetical protein
MPAPLPSTRLSHSMTEVSTSVPAAALVSIETYIDLDCPFSRKIWRTLRAQVVPAYVGFPVEFIFSHVPQPWHPQSVMLHEVSLGVRHLDASLYHKFIDIVFDNQELFYDDVTMDKSRMQIYDMLIQLAGSIGLSEENQKALKDLLACPVGTGNKGNHFCQMIKFVTKYHRLRGVHVTPTVFVNGLEAAEVSSGWGLDQWRDFIDRILHS